MIVTVADSGAGIDGEHLEKIFDPLFTTKPGGTGLGLPICADILQRLGGRLDADNRPEGGAIVTVRLPLQFNHPVESGTQ